MYIKALQTVLGVLFNKDTRKAVGKVIALILSPFLLILLAISAMGDASSQHNQEVITTLFDDKAIPATIPQEFKNDLELMQSYFQQIDEESEQIQTQVQSGTLDLIRIKALFLSIYLQQTLPDLEDETIHDYVLCFTETSERQNEENSDDTENVSSKQLTVLSDMEKIKDKVESLLDCSITEEMRESYLSIVALVNPGANASTQGEGLSLSERFTPLIEESNKKTYVGGKMSSPFMDDWQSNVSSEFG